MPPSPTAIVSAVGFYPTNGAKSHWARSIIVPCFDLYCYDDVLFLFLFYFSGRES